MVVTMFLVGGFRCAKVILGRDYSLADKVAFALPAVLFAMAMVSGMFEDTFGGRASKPTFLFALIFGIILAYKPKPVRQQQNVKDGKPVMA